MAIKPIKTRIAPSPTGPLHIGTARSALFNEIFAIQNKGKFVLRIEDTDKERSKKEFEDDIVEGFKWLDIVHHEFHRQSERLHIYKKYIQKLLEERKAFWCYHTKEELEQEKEKQLKNKEAPRHECEHKPKTRNPKLETKEKGIIRLRGTDKTIKFHDLIRDDIEIKGRVLGDIALAKNEDEPLYNFAVVVDDYEMEITHVIRGEDHISNTPKQILIHKALRLNPPLYGHLPLILGPDRSKISKRHGATSVNEYRKNGYLPAALTNFMAFLGWNPGDDRELMNKKEIVKSFSLEKVQKAGAIFNIEKLNWFNREYIRTMPTEKLSEELKNYLPSDWRGKAEKNSEFWKKTVELERPRLSRLSEITEGTEYLFEKPKLEKDSLNWKEESAENTVQYIDTTIKLLCSLTPEGFTADLAKKAIWGLAEEKGKGNVLWPFRMALTGLLKSPDPFSVSEILGKEETLRRLKSASELLRAR